GIRDFHVTGVQTCALPILRPAVRAADLHRILYFRADPTVADPPDPVRSGRACAGDVLPAAAQPERALQVRLVLPRRRGRLYRPEIGRASCREGVWVVAVRV